MPGSFLQQALVFLTAAVVCVPLAKRLGMGSVLGFLLAGMLIGPYALGFVGAEGKDIMHGAEFGVVMMLFLIGLELDPREFWKMRRSIVGLGLGQMALSAILLGAVAHLALGWSHTVSLAAALALSMSSTAIVLQTLKERGESRSTTGQAAFSVLLFQDISVIPILALLPLLGYSAAGSAAEAGGHNLLADLPAWARPLCVLGAVALIYLLGRFVVSPFLRLMARTRLREMFVASALLLVVGVTYLMELVGLSPALGTFLAGVVLANSEFRHELESDLEPFKGLLLGLFFIGVGASINFARIAADPVLVLGLAAIVLAVKGAVLYAVGRFSKMRSDNNLLFSFLLSQVGEFAFVLLTFSNQLRILDADTTDLLMAVTAVTMTVTPLLLLLNERVIDPRFGTRERADEKPADAIDEQHPVIIAGFGHFGSTIGRFLRANGVKTTILDYDPDRVDLLRKMGFKVYYGDATRLDLLHAAGAADARLLIAAIDDPGRNYELIRTVRKHFPALRVLARARNRFDAYELIDMGVENIYRETLYTAVHLAVDVLAQLGFRRYTAARKGQEFIQYDEAALQKLAVFRHDLKTYILNTRQEIELQERLLSEDLHQNMTAPDTAWDTEALRS
jgi:CPA2 family monovalent cation:H+ antiporter-2